MVEVLEKHHFKEMPWKNGGGTTTELFRIGTPDEFSFRLSVAEIKQDGPFSLFPELKRVLYLLSGQNMCLSFPDNLFVLNKPFDYSEFNGNTPVSCSLKSGPCRDFNLMFNPGQWSLIFHRSLEVNAETSTPIQSHSHHHFVFLAREFKLIHLEPGQTFVLTPVSDEIIIEMALAKK